MIGENFDVDILRWISHHIFAPSWASREPPRPAYSLHESTSLSPTAVNRVTITYSRKHFSAHQRFSQPISQLHMVILYISRWSYWCNSTFHIHVSRQKHLHSCKLILLKSMKLEWNSIVIRHDKTQDILIKHDPTKWNYAYIS